MNRLTICLALTVSVLVWEKAPAAPPLNASPAAEGIVVMPPYQVIPVAGWGLSFKYDRKKNIREIIFYVERGSLAARAGLQAGDRLTAVDGKSVIGMTSAEYGVLAKNAGMKKKEGILSVLTVIRNGKSLDFSMLFPI